MVVSSLSPDSGKQWLGHWQQSKICIKVKNVKMKSVNIAFVVVVLVNFWWVLLHFCWCYQVKTLISSPVIMAKHSPTALARGQQHFSGGVSECREPQSFCCSFGSISQWSACNYKPFINHQQKNDMQGYGRHTANTADVSVPAVVVQPQTHLFRAVGLLRI